jgi:hypothetical protein
MTTAGSAFLALLFTGVLCLLAGLILVRAHWRPDISPYGRGVRLPPLLWYPQRYTQGAPLRLIRILSVAGCLFLVGALAVVVAAIAGVMLAR